MRRIGLLPPFRIWRHLCYSGTCVHGLLRWPHPPAHAIRCPLIMRFALWTEERDCPDAVMVRRQSVPQDWIVASTVISRRSRARDVDRGCHNNQDFLPFPVLSFSCFSTLLQFTLLHRRHCTVLLFASSRLSYSPYYSSTPFNFTVFLQCTLATYCRYSPVALSLTLLQSTLAHSRYSTVQNDTGLCPCPWVNRGDFLPVYSSSHK